MSDWYTLRDKELVLNVSIQPRASRDEICGIHGDTLKIRITAPPVDGKANAHLIAFLAKQCRLSKSSVSVISGSTARHKRVRLQLLEPTLPAVLAAFD